MVFNGSLSVEEIADYMGKSKLFVRKSIENGSLPIGCFSKEGNRTTYYISPKRAFDYMGYKRDEESIDNSTTNYVSNS